MKWRPTRDGVMFVAGLAGLIHETVFTPSSDPALIVVFSGMCGLPLVRAVDRS